MTDSTRCGGKKKIPVQEFGASTFWESCKGCVDCKPKCKECGRREVFRDDLCDLCWPNTPDPGVDVEELVGAYQNLYLKARRGDERRVRGYWTPIQYRQMLRQLSRERDEAVKGEAIALEWHDSLADRAEKLIDERTLRAVAAEQRAEKAEGLLREWMNYTNEPDDGSVDFVDVVFELNWRKKVRAATEAEGE